MLDLSVAEETDRSLVRLLPELGFSEAQRIPKANHRVEPFRQSLQISLSLGPANCQSSDDRRRRSAAQPAGRVERVHAEELVDQAARDAKHGRTAILTFDVELERADLRIIIAH